MNASDAQTFRASDGQALAPAGALPYKRLVIRVGLVALAVPYTVLALWLVISPHSFYESFPGLGAHWVRPTGAYSEHGFTDFGSALLGLAFVVWAAAYLLERRVVQVALIASLLQGTTHFAHHMLHLDVMSTANDIGNQAALSYFVLLPLALLLATRRGRSPQTAGGAPH